MTAPHLSPLDDHSLQRLADALESRRVPDRRSQWLDRAITWMVGILLAWGALQVDVAVLKQRVDAQDVLLKEVRDDIKTLLQRVPIR